MKRSFIRTVAVLVALGLLTATSALASRAPTKCENLAIRSSIGSFIKWGKVAAKNAKITSIRVSTASSSYAFVKVFSKGVGPGFALMHLSSGAWGVVQFGTQLSCKGVPSGVRKDLKLPCV